MTTENTVGLQMQVMCNISLRFWKITRVFVQIQVEKWQGKRNRQGHRNWESDLGGSRGGGLL